MKILIIALGIVILGYFIGRLLKPKDKGQNPQEELMLQCHKCGTFVSQKEAIVYNKHYYCSKQCLPD